MIAQAAASGVAGADGVVALMSSIITLAAVKGFDYFLQKKGTLDDSALKEATAIRKELREETRSLKDDLRAIVVDNDQLRNEYFDLRSLHNEMTLNRDKLESDRTMYRTLTSQLKIDVIKLEDILKASDTIDPKVELQLERLLEDIVFIENSDSYNREP